MSQMGGSPRGQCVSCGYLSRLSQTPEGYTDSRVPVYYEAHPESRASGQLFRVHDPNVVNCDSLPACLVHASDLYDELLASQRRDADPNERASGIMVVITRDRRCVHWTPYRVGFSPKEHLEERRRAEQEEARKRWEEQQEVQRREWERSLENERRGWETAREEERRGWEAQQAERHRSEERRFNKVMLWVAVAGFVLAVVQVLTATFALTPDALVVQWFAEDQVPGASHTEAPPLGTAPGTRLP